MTRIVRTLRVPWVALAALASCTAAPPAEQATAAGALNISGELLVTGCTPRARELVVTAAPTTPVPFGQQAGQPGEPIAAQIVATSNPRRFRIMFESLDPTIAYRIAAYSRSQTCAPLAWKGPRGGWFVPGAQPLRVEGHAMRTQTEVLGLRDQGAIWVGSEAIDLTIQDTARTVRWRTDVPGAVAGVVQVSLSAFQVGSAAQQQVPLIASWQVPLPQQGWGELSIDFAAFARCDLQQHPNGCPFDELEAARREIRGGAPMHLRVVPIDANGAILGDTAALGIAAEIHVAHLPRIDIVQPPPPPPVPPLLYHGTYKRGFPEVASTHNGGCYRVVQTHPIPAYSDYDADKMGWVFGYSWGMPTYMGNFFVDEATCVDHVGGTFLDDVVNAVSGLMDAIGTAVDKVAALYAEIKAAVIEFAASAIEFVGIPCESTCRLLLTTALDTALAAMGLPPSLPNWNELVERGTDYLVQMAAEETGVPEEALRLVVEKIRDDITAKRGIPGAEGWLIAIDGFQAPSFELKIRRDPASSEATVGALELAPTRAFLGSTVILPTHALDAGETVTIPVVLLPNFDGIPRERWCAFGVCSDAAPAVQQAHAEHVWYDTRYANAHCQDLKLTGYFTGFLGASRIFIPGPGVQVLWHISTLGYHDSDNPFLFDCPP